MVDKGSGSERAPAPPFDKTVVTSKEKAQVLQRHASALTGPMAKIARGPVEQFVKAMGEADAARAPLEAAAVASSVQAART